MGPPQHRRPAVLRGRSTAGRNAQHRLLRDADLAARAPLDSCAQRCGLGHAVTQVERRTHDESARVHTYVERRLPDAFRHRPLEPLQPNTCGQPPFDVGGKPHVARIGGVDVPAGSDFEVDAELEEFLRAGHGIGRTHRNSDLLGRGPGLCTEHCRHGRDQEVQQRQRAGHLEHWGCLQRWTFPQRTDFPGAQAFRTPGADHPPARRCAHYPASARRKSPTSGRSQSAAPRCLSTIAPLRSTMYVVGSASSPKASGRGACSR